MIPPVMEHAIKPAKNKPASAPLLLLSVLLAMDTTSPLIRNVVFLPCSIFPYIRAMMRDAVREPSTDA